MSRIDMPFTWTDTPDRPRATIEARVSDDAMAPEFMQGCYVTADLCRLPVDGDAVLLVFETRRSQVARLRIDLAGTRFLEDYASPPHRLPFPVDARQVLLVTSRHLRFR